MFPCPLAIANQVIRWFGIIGVRMVRPLPPLQHIHRNGDRDPQSTRRDLKEAGYAAYSVCTCAPCAQVYEQLRFNCLLWGVKFSLVKTEGYFFE